MIHPSTEVHVAVPRSAPQLPASQECELLDPLLRLAGDIQNAHALIVAQHSLDLMCGLIRHGCLAATTLRVGDKPDAGDYDVVFVPHVAELPSVDVVVRLARMALVPNGQLIVGMSLEAQAVRLARRLRLNGFSSVRSLRAGSSILLSADLRRLS